MVAGEDLLLVPTRWRDFLGSSPEIGNNRRLISNTLESRYLENQRTLRGNPMRMQFSYEAEEHVGEVKIILAAMDPKSPPAKEWREMENLLLLRKMERLETLRLFMQGRSEVAKAFFKKVRETPPSKEKALMKIKNEVVKDPPR